MSNINKKVRYQVSGITNRPTNQQKTDMKIYREVTLPIWKGAGSSRDACFHIFFEIILTIWPLYLRPRYTLLLEKYN